MPNDDDIPPPEVARATTRPVAVPADLRGAHRFVLATREAAVGARAEADGRLKIGPRAGVAHVVLSRSLLRRALLLLEGIVCEALRRDWDVVALARAEGEGRPGIAIEIRGHRYRIEVHEAVDGLPFTDAEIAAWRTEWKWEVERRADRLPPGQLKRKRPTGQLRLVLPYGSVGARTIWSEGPRGSLESKLSSVFPGLEARAIADDEAALAWARRQEEGRRARDARVERECELRIENGRVTRLLSGVDAWRQSAEVRAYVAVLEESSAGLGVDERKYTAEWCAWAMDWADRSDPSRHVIVTTGRDGEKQ